MRLLITGASGMLGATLVKSLEIEHEVYATASSNFAGGEFQNFKVFDLRNENYALLISWSKPEVIIHAAALTNGNYCAQNPEDALLVNGLTSYKFLEATEEQTKVIYVSSDAVFPSELHNAREFDTPMPESIYGKSKELGEFFLLNTNRKVQVLRTTLVGLNQNPARSGFVEWILNSSKNAEKISLFDDVIFTPISIWQFTKQLKFLIENDIDERILHLVSKDFCSKYHFGIELLNSLNMDTQNVEKGSILSFKNRSKRSTDQTMSSVLSSKKLEIQLPSVQEVIQDIKENISIWHK